MTGSAQLLRAPPHLHQRVSAAGLRPARRTSVQIQGLKDEAGTAVPEKDYMYLPEACSPSESKNRRPNMTNAIIPLRPSRPAPGARPALECEPVEDTALRCVSSGYAQEGCSCARRIPRGVVLAAWHSAAAATGEGFFEVDWEGGRWLSYGRSDGTVAGVYCPTHSLARATRRSRAEREHEASRLRLAA